MYSQSFVDNNLFLTCVGAYDDSGVGTGGFVFVNDGNVVVIDKLDSTGLFVNGDTIYRFIRQMKAIVGYSAKGIRSFLRVSDTKDVHDLRLTDEGFVCVNTGRNEIVWFTPLGERIKTWHADGKNDAWHLNCIEEINGEFYASAFGEFKTHREWVGKANQAGFIMNLATGKKIIENLTGPHNPRYFDEKWFVCESHLSALTVISADGIVQRIQLEGFTRGLTYNEKFIFVGESANRKAEFIPDFSHIVVIDRNSLEILERIRIPFPEIYEIVVAPPEIDSSLKKNISSFQFDFNDDRIAFLEEQINRLRTEILVLKESMSLRTGIKKKLIRLFSRRDHEK